MSLATALWLASVAIIYALLATSPALAADSVDTACPVRVSETSAAPYWATLSDFYARLLTVPQSIQNTGSCSSCAISIDNIAADKGVSLITPMPLDLGWVPLSASRQISVQYRIPAGIGQFHSRVHAVCQPQPATLPAAPEPVIEPVSAYANEGCPVTGDSDPYGQPLPLDQTYGARRFTVSLFNSDGTPAAGHSVKWSLSNEVGFRFLERSEVTDGNGQTFAVVTPPQYFICITPYFDRATTDVMADTSDGRAASAPFAYTRCAPIGATPPWAAPVNPPSL